LWRQRSSVLNPPAGMFVLVILRMMACTSFPTKTSEKTLTLNSVSTSYRAPIMSFAATNTSCSTTVCARVSRGGDDAS
ncbi:hypothetical protein C8Q72DRAFT_866497, partial [Fomitopsis betulina]